MTKEFYPEKNGKRIPSVYDLQKNISVILVSNHIAMHFPHPTMPNVINIGGMNLKTDSKGLPNDIKQFLDEVKDGVIYFNLGTNMKSSEMSEKLLNMFMENFRQRPQRVI